MRIGPGRDAVPQPVDALHHYRVYGCTIASSFPLLELPRATATGLDDADLTISAASLELPMPSGEDWRLIDIAEGASRFAWSGFGRVAIENNRRILVDLDPDFDRDLLGFILLGPVLAATLQGRGMSVLHGSAIAPPRPDAAA